MAKAWLQGLNHLLLAKGDMQASASGDVAVGIVDAANQEHCRAASREVPAWSIVIVQPVRQCMPPCQRSSACTDTGVIQIMVVVPSNLGRFDQGTDHASCFECVLVWYKRCKIRQLAHILSM